MARSQAVRVAVMRAAGTNCDCETAYAFEKAGATADRLHVNRLAEKPALLSEYHILALPGGFSYGDDVASGKVLANEIRSRLEEPMRLFISKGKPVIGICNGFQVLVKAGLLPGLAPCVQASLTGNDSARFEARWVHLKAEESVCIFVKPGDDMYLPVAHGEGKFVADPKTLAALDKKRLVVMRYATPEGAVCSEYPGNPNGSVNGIAGICDATGRIFGLMPHPERHVEPTQHPRWTREGLQPEGDGMKVFRNAVEFVRRELL